MMPAHETYDVIVIGAGAGGMTSAAVAAAEGLRVLVIEKTAFVGGTTAWSGGMVWIPANAKMKEAGLEAQECRLIPKDMVHETEEVFIGWLRTAWHPYTANVPLELKDEFLRETAQHYIAGHPLDAQGRVHVATVRLQVRAKLTT